MNCLEYFNFSWRFISKEVQTAIRKIRQLKSKREREREREEGRGIKEILVAIPIIIKLQLRNV